MRFIIVVVVICISLITGCTENVSPTLALVGNEKSTTELQGIWTLTKVESTKFFSSKNTPFVYTEVSELPENEQMYYMDVQNRSGLAFMSSTNNTLDEVSPFTYSLEHNIINVQFDKSSESHLLLLNIQSPTTIQIFDKDIRFTFERKNPIRN